jgi:hypothetical protein
MNPRICWRHLKVGSSNAMRVTPLFTRWLIGSNIHEGARLELSRILQVPADLLSHQRVTITIQGESSVSYMKEKGFYTREGKE